jgi:hypothetical protein
VDSSSGAIGAAVNRAIEELVGVIAAAPADVKTREAWLERLYEALAADGIRLGNMFRWRTRTIRRPFSSSL